MVRHLAKRIFMILPISNRVSAGVIKFSLTLLTNLLPFVSPWLGAKAPPWATPKKMPKPSRTKLGKIL